MKAKTLLKEFEKYDIGPYIEVPCSILAPLIFALEKNGRYEVMNPVNEAAAMGLAAGSYLATGRVPAVIMQNAGLCNALNALTSLNAIYKIPVLYLISWRGQPDTDDAPEHEVIGRTLKKLLRLYDIPYEVLSKEGYKSQISSMAKYAKCKKRPSALILKKGICEEDYLAIRKTGNGMDKEEAVGIILEIFRGKAWFITTNGYISRYALAFLRQSKDEKNEKPFYMLGSMGHALSIGIGLGRYAKGSRRVLVLDGDGGCLMHIGSMASLDRCKDKRIIHIVLDDGVYASTGGQKTLSANLDLCGIARGFGYINSYEVNNRDNLRHALNKLLRKSGPSFMRILVRDDSSRSKPPRISDDYSCEEIKDGFMSRLLRERKR